MRIQDSAMQMASQHQAVQKHSKSESLRTWVGSQRPAFEGNGGRGAASVRDRVVLSEQARAAMQSSGKEKTVEAAAVDPDKALENDPRTLLIRLMIEALTGKKIKVTSAEEIQPDAAAQPDPAPAQQPDSAGFGVEYDYHESYYEAESMNFSAQGVIHTADGQEIRFDLQLAMERLYTREESVSLRLGDAARPKKDPLTINFGGTAAQLTSTKFGFDIDADGSTEQISFVAPNSGFIALDKNGDGKINDGGELFGAESGDGFQELAAYDDDRNGWIDENDAAFEKLKVWLKDAEGNDILVALKLKGVGALYLGREATPFELKNSLNDSLGAVRSSGVYLNESGGVGTLQQIDLTV